MRRIKSKKVDMGEGFDVAVKANGIQVEISKNGDVVIYTDGSRIRTHEKKALALSKP